MRKNDDTKEPQGEPVGTCKEDQEMNTYISLTNTQYCVLSRILCEYRNNAMGVTYGEWVVINGMLEACGLKPRDFTGDTDYADVLAAFGKDK